jgi:hypothetical protein
MAGLVRPPGTGDVGKGAIEAVQAVDIRRGRCWGDVERGTERRELAVGGLGRRCRRG